MTGTASSCSDDRLQVLLDGNEQDADFRSAAEHLESCPRCQSRLPELAADHEDWDRAKRSLLMDKTDELIERERSERTWSVAGRPI